MNKYDSLYTGSHNDQYHIRITALEGLSTTANGRLTALESASTTASSRIDGLENFSTTANNRITALETIHVGDLVVNGHNIISIANNIDLTTTPEEDNYSGKGLKFKDVNGTEFGFILGIHLSDDRTGILIGTSREVNGDMIYNSFHFRISSTGEITRHVSSPISLIPGTTSQSVSFTTNITSAASSWKDFLVNWIAPDHGWLLIYLNGSNTPAALITDNDSGLLFRENGNGSRDYCITIPVAKGHSYTGSCVYSKTSSATFYPAATSI